MEVIRKFCPVSQSEKGLMLVINLKRFPVDKIFGFLAKKKIQLTEQKELKLWIIINIIIKSTCIRILLKYHSVWVPSAI